MQPLPRDPWPSHLPPSFFAALSAEGDDQPSDTAAVDATATLQRLLLALPDGVLSLDAHWRCRHANPAAQPLLRPSLSWEHVAGQSWHEVLDDEWIEALLPWMATVMRGEAGQFTLQRGHDDQAHHWRVSLLPERSGDDVVGAFVLLRDETAMQQQQAAWHAQQRDLQQRLQHQDAHLAEQQARWQALSGSLRDAAIFFLDTHGAIQDWPSSAERLLGYAAPAVLGTTGPDTPEHPHPLPADTALALERAALLGQAESTGWLRRANGDRLWAHWVFATLTGPQGEPLGTACLVRDMTEARRLEALLREWNQALEREVDERTRQLQAAIADLEAFSYSVSHDLRAPLRHITSYVRLLREDLGAAPSADVAEDLRIIDEAATRMGQLIDGLLAFARLGRTDLRRQPVDMLDLLRSSLNRVQHDPSLRRADGEVELHLPARLPAVEGDPLLLSQVWDNLLGNAFKYSRPRQPAIITAGGEVRDAADGTREAVFWVRDNGVGFDPARAERLFGVFQRLHRPQDFEGTGIGLALCRRIIERHGGRIWAESQPEQGATFAFTLPLSAPSGHATTAPDATHPSP
jgi:PAS domain S-box-containing protein